MRWYKLFILYILIIMSSHDDKNTEITETTETTDNKHFTIQLNHKYFILSLVELVDTIAKKSNELEDVKNNSNQVKLRHVCGELKSGFTSDKSEFDQARIVKKIYKVITKNITKLYQTPTIDLFSLKDDKGSTVTIIPGLDIKLVVDKFTNEELELFWGHFSMLYIASVEMVTIINNHKKEGKVWDIIPKLKEKVIKVGITRNGKMFNPYIGIMRDNDTYDVGKMFENVDKLETPEGLSLETIFKYTGIDKMVDPSQIQDQLQNIKPEEISDATRQITKLLGAENDKDINEVCGTLVEGIVDDLRQNKGGLKGMFETAKSVTEKLGSKLDKNKMKKTAQQMTGFLQNGESNLRGMTDDKGNNIGEKIFQSIKLPLQMVQNMDSGKKMNPQDFQNMMKSVNDATKVAADLQNKN